MSLPNDEPRRLFHVAADAITDFEELRQYDPAIDALVESAEIFNEMHHEAGYVCGCQPFYSRYRNPPGFRRLVESLVGWKRIDDDPRLANTIAYDAVYRGVWTRLPACAPACGRETRRTPEQRDGDLLAAFEGSENWPYLFDQIELVAAEDEARIEAREEARRSRPTELRPVKAPPVEPTPVAVDSETDRVALNGAAFSMGRQMARSHIPVETAISSLLDVGRALSLTEATIEQTITSGIEAGIKRQEGQQ